MPPASSTETRDYSPHPWRRWFARIIDLLSTSFLLGILTAVAGSPTALSNNAVATVVSALALVFLEATCLATIGTTPGKAVMNARVENTDGTALTWTRAFARSIRVWWGGMGAGIPLVSLFTMAFQHKRLTTSGSASYDAAEGFRVSHGPISAGRRVLIALAVVIYVYLVVIGTKP